MARKALIDNNIIGIFRNSPFVYGNISTHICSRNMAASVAINITAQTSAVYGNRSEIPFIFPIIMPKSIVSEFPSSQHCLFAVQGISQRLFSSTSITTIPMHSTSIVKDLHDKSTSTVRLVQPEKGHSKLLSLKSMLTLKSSSLDNRPQQRKYILIILVFGFNKGCRQNRD